MPKRHDRAPRRPDTKAPAVRWPGDDSANRQVKPAQPVTRTIAAVLSAEADACRSLVEGLWQRGWQSSRIGRAMGYADGTPVSKLMSGGSATPRMVVSLAVLGQTLGLTGVVQARCVGGYGVVSLPGSPPPGDWLSYLSRLMSELRTAAVALVA